MRIIPTRRGAEGQGGPEAPLPLLGQGPTPSLRLPRGPGVPGRPCPLLDIYLAVQGSRNTETLVHAFSRLAPSPSSLLPAAALALPGRWGALHARGPCPTSPEPGSARGPGNRASPFPWSNGEERAWRGAEPTGLASASGPPDCPLLG